MSDVSAYTTRDLRLRWNVAHLIGQEIGTQNSTVQAWRLRDGAELIVVGFILGLFVLI